MNELSLFTGAGGGILGTKLLGWKHIGYVEIDDYCQKILAQRIKDGILDNAPIFGDIKTFINSGCAELYKKITDIITAGFPCQPFSVAGKRQGEADERNMWPATADVIRIVLPRFVLLENVPGIRQYLPVVLRDLRRLGYTVRRPLQLGADDTGAPHRRKRIWIMAQSISAGTLDNARTLGGDRGRGTRGNEQTLRQAHGPHGTDRLDTTSEVKTDVASATSQWSGGLRNPGKEEGSQNSDELFGIGNRIRGKTQNLSDTGKHTKRSTYGKDIRANKQRENESNKCKGDKIRRNIANNYREWPIEPDVGRMAHGVASRVDRLKAIGNGQVPRVVATAWRLFNMSQEAVK